MMPVDIFKTLIEESIEYWDKKAQKIDDDSQSLFTSEKRDLTLTKDNEYSTICQSLQSNSHFPTIHDYTLLRRKFEIEIEAHKIIDASLSLLQSQAISFHHQAMNQYNKRIFKLNEKLKYENSAKPSNCNKPEEELDILDSSSAEEDDDGNTWSREGESMEQMLTRILSFRSCTETVQKFSEYLKKLPKEWRIVQISTDPSSKAANPFKAPRNADDNREDNHALMIVSIECNNRDIQQDDIVVHRVPAINSGENKSILNEFQHILATHKRIYTTDENFDKQRHNKNREDLDNRLESVLQTIENKWLGYAKCLLFGRPINEEAVEKVKRALQSLSTRFFENDETFNESGRKALLSRCLDAIDSLSEPQLRKCLLQCLQNDEDRLPELIEAVRAILPSTDDGMFSQKHNENRHPIILILDQEIQCLPWESLRCFQDTKYPQPMTRVPSIGFLFALMAAQETNATSVSKTGVRDENIYYVLNPDKNLAKTQKRLEGAFQQMSIEKGLIGEQPSLDKMQKVLSEMDTYIYCGHGDGRKNLPTQEIEKINIRAVPLLFGCNSGRLNKFARALDPIGTASSYLIATAPCVLGFLWSVTDRDLDKWTEGFLKYWLGKGDGPQETNFVRAVANRRSNFDRIINSAATVVYGLPIVSAKMAK